MVSQNKKVLDLRSDRSEAPSMIGFLYDLPNICTLTGLASALLGIYYAVLGRFGFALIGVLWAVVFDWADGMIARKIRGRTENQRAYGAQLDSLVDLISFGVFPAGFLLSYGQFQPWFLPGAFIIIAVSAVRLGYFNLFGMIDKKTYKGLAIDNNVLLLAALFLLEGAFPHKVFSIILYTVLMILPVFNLASIPTYKFGGKWFYVLLLYVAVMTVIYGWFL